MNRRGRGNRRQRTTRRVKNFVTPAQLRRDNRGFIPRGRFDPPRIVTQPWNSVTLAAFSSISAAGVHDYSVSSLTTLLQTQLGTNANALLLRFMRVDVWTTPIDVVTNTALNFALRASDLMAPDESDGYMQWIEDFGTQARPAHCHYVWPQTSQTRVFASQQDGATAIFSVDVPIAQSLIVHVHVLWKFWQADPVPSSRLQLIPTPRDIELNESFGDLHLDEG